MISTKKRIKLVGMQVASALVFAWHVRIGEGSMVSWLVPLTLVLFIIMNSIWFTRFLSWVIFSGAFFGFLVVLSAFTLRWRLEPGFSAVPFYKSLLMYSLFVYVSLAQIKILGDAQQPQTNSVEEKNEK